MQKKRNEEKAKKEAAEKAAKDALAAKNKPEPVADSGACEEVTDEMAEQIEREEAAKKAAREKGEELPEGKAPDAEEKKDEEDKGADPSAGNGGKTDKYWWEQNLNEVFVNIPIAKDVVSKMLNLDIKSKTFKYGFKGKEPLIQGEWNKPIKTDDTLWCIETDMNGDKFITISLTKKEGQNWWDCVLQGDPKINTQKVEPENSKLGDLDGDTRGVVEKMMFD